MATGFFAPETASLKPWPGRNFGTEVAFSFTCAPVAGLRATLAARLTFSKTPKPAIATFSPFETVRVTASTTASTATAAARLSPIWWVIASISSALFTTHTSKD